MQVDRHPHHSRPAGPPLSATLAAGCLCTTNTTQHNQAESDKYYKWPVNEVSAYIANNSKMIDRTIAAQAAQQQQ